MLKETAGDYAFAAWGLAKKFFDIRSKPMILMPQDGKSIRSIHIDPKSLAMGNLRVDAAPQPGRGGPRRWTIYDLDHPPIATNDVGELRILAEIMLSLDTPEFPRSI